MSLSDTMSFSIAAGIVPCFEGDPGEGKTAIMESLSELDYHIEVILGSVRQPSDYIGYPIKNDEEKTLDFYAPKWAVDANNRAKQGIETIILFDELTTAPPMVQAAQLRVINEKVVGDVQLDSSMIHMAAAQNPKEQAMGFDLTIPMKNRFTHIKVDTDEQWYKWIEDGGKAAKPQRFDKPDKELVMSIMKDIAAFIKKKPDYMNGANTIGKSSKVKAYPSKRTWHHTAKILATAATNFMRKAQVMYLVRGTIGEEAAESFMGSFKLPIVTYDYVILNKDTARFLSETSPNKMLHIIKSWRTMIPQVTVGVDDGTPDNTGSRRRGRRGGPGQSPPPPYGVDPISSDPPGFSTVPPWEKKKEKKSNTPLQKAVDCANYWGLMWLAINSNRKELADVVFNNKEILYDFSAMPGCPAPMPKHLNDALDRGSVEGVEVKPEDTKLPIPPPPPPLKFDTAPVVPEPLKVDGMLEIESTKRKEALAGLSMLERVMNGNDMLIKNKITGTMIRWGNASSDLQNMIMSGDRKFKSNESVFSAYNEARKLFHDLR